MDRAPLDRWVHKDGKVVLLGDACHPMLVRMVRMIVVMSNHPILAISCPRFRNGREFQNFSHA